MRRSLLGLGLALGALSCWSVASAVIPLEVFAAPDYIVDVAISPDGHHLGEVVQKGDQRFAVVVDLQGHDGTKPVLANSANGFEITGCNWASATRLVCAYHGVSYIVGRTPLDFTRLVAVDADGKHQLVLLNGTQASGSQFDRIIDWNAGPDTILVEASESLLDAKSQSAGAEIVGVTGTGPYPAVFALNVVTGRLQKSASAVRPIVSYISDFHGNPRFGFGNEPDSTVIQYFVRQHTGWQHLLQYEAFAKNTPLRPIAMDANDSMRAYGIGDYQGRDALWSVNLSDKQPPQLIYADSKVDVGPTLFLKDGTLLGVVYDTERPHVYYTDPKLKALMNDVDAALPDTWNVIVDASSDRSLLLVRATSDVEPGAYFLFEPAKSQLRLIGRSNDALDASQLGKMLWVSFKARDGTEIPGYLTKPPGAMGDRLPLIVMPHGGPIARDSWRYFFLQQFLVNRGYAVLQMNFRGSGGYGDQWFGAAHQDWGGQTYDDIIDGVQWAIKSGVADPKRIAIVGWSFGGYAALLGAARDSDLFRCAISIAGISDLSLLENESDVFLAGRIMREQIGTDRAKLRRDSPRLHVADIKVPVLLVHGDKDVNVNVEQSAEMASALKSAGKSSDFVRIKDATHQLERGSDRLTLLNAVEKFLDANDPIGETAAAANISH